MQESKVYKWPGQYASVVELPPMNQEVTGSNSWSGHILGLCVWSPAGHLCQRQPIDVDISLSLHFPSFLLKIQQNFFLNTTNVKQIDMHEYTDRKKHIWKAIAN